MAPGADCLVFIMGDWIAQAQDRSAVDRHFGGHGPARGGDRLAAYGGHHDGGVVQTFFRSFGAVRGLAQLVLKQGNLLFEARALRLGDLQSYGQFQNLTPVGVFGHLARSSYLIADQA